MAVKNIQIYGVHPLCRDKLTIPSSRGGGLSKSTSKSFKTCNGRMHQFFKTCNGRMHLLSEGTFGDVW